MGIKNKVIKKPINDVKFAISKKGLHLKLNDFREFIIPSEQVKSIYDEIVRNESKEEVQNTGQAGV